MCQVDLTKVLINWTNFCKISVRNKPKGLTLNAVKCLTEVSDAVE